MGIQIVEVGRCDLWDTDTIHELQQKQGWGTDQFGECCYYKKPDGSIKVTIYIIRAGLIKWFTTLAHEYGHARIALNNADKSIYEIKVLQDEYDAWNRHGWLFWRV